jgi:hypothetical protein
MSGGWWVVRDKKIIASGPQPVTEEVARESAARWNTLFAGASYEAISEAEGIARHARQVRWEDSLEKPPRGGT